MKRSVLLYTACLIAVLFMFAAPAARADNLVFNFDDLATPNTVPGASNWGYVPTGYQGFTWSGFEVTAVDAQFDSVYGTSLQATSTPNAAYNGGSGNAVVSISSGTPFNFVGADFAYWPGVGGYASNTVTVTGYLNNVQVDSPVVVNLGDPFAWASIGLNGVDQVQIASDSQGSGRYFLMDNATFETPEPVTLGFVGIGLLAFCFAGRRFVGHQKR
jgi:hypothetical protein